MVKFFFGRQKVRFLFSFSLSLFSSSAFAVCPMHCNVFYARKKYISFTFNNRFAIFTSLLI